MTNNIKCFASFVIGAAVSFAVSWGFLKTKYEQIANDEIESVKEVFAARKFEPAIAAAKNISDGVATQERDKFVSTTTEWFCMRSDAPETVSTDHNDILEAPCKKPKSVVDYSHMCNNLGYSSENKEKGGDIMSNDPYVISPDEFGEKDDYDTVSLTYYADGVLADECDDVIYNVDNVIGEDSLNHFGEYEEDSVFVRNDSMATDYEILRDLRAYSDVVGSTPSVNNDED